MLKLKCLELDGCTNLEIISVKALPSLLEFSIPPCPELKILILSFLNSLERIPIDGFGKLETLIISYCTQLKKLCVAGLSFVEIIVIKGCEELQNIAGIEELPSLKYLELSMCRNAALTNIISRLQRVPHNRLTVIGIAVEGAKSMLGPHLFSDSIGAEAVIEFEKKEDYFVRRASVELETIMPERVIVCVVGTAMYGSSYVVLQFLSCSWNQLIKFDSQQFVAHSRKWIFTAIVTNQQLLNHIGDLRIKTSRGARIEKVCMGTLKKGEGRKALDAMMIICDQLIKE